MDYFAIVTRAYDIRLAVEKICGDNGVSVDLSSPDGFGSQAGKLADLLGVEVWIALKIILEANPWPAGTKNVHASDLSVEHLYAFQRFQQGCHTMISIFDIVPERLLHTRPQPPDGVVEEFVQQAVRTSVDKGTFKLLENGSIIHSFKGDQTMKTPLFLRPRLKFPSGHVLLPDLRTAMKLRDRMCEIMWEVEAKIKRQRK